jgi:hypothetical protein
MTVTLDREKRRDGPQNDRHTLRLDQVDGTESGVISAHTEPPERNTDRMDVLMGIFVAHFSAEGASRSELLRVAVESGMSEATFRRALNDLLNHRDLISDGTASRSHYRTP